MGYICYLEGFIEPSKSLGGKYKPSKKFRGQKQTLFYIYLHETDRKSDRKDNRVYQRDER
jgi:hypothetical protein